MRKSYSDVLGFDNRVLDEFLEEQPPHLSMVRSIEAVYYRKYLPFKGKILDIGCGDGFFAQSVYNRQMIDTGVDVAKSLWKEAKNRGNYRQVLSYDGYKLPFADNSFDTVVSNCVLEHVANVDILIKEISRVLKKKGLLVVTVITDTYGRDLLGTKIFGESYSRWFNRKSIHVANVAAEEWQQRLERAGLKVTEAAAYMDRKHLMYWLDITHYWGVINLIHRKLTGKWTWGLARFSNIWWKKVFLRVMKTKSSPIKSGFLFLTATKV